MPLRLGRCTSGREVKPYTLMRALLFTRLEFGFGDGGSKRCRNRGDFHKFIERLFAKELVHAIGQPLDRRAIDDLLRRRGENELFAGIGERVVRDERGDVA